MQAEILAIGSELTSGATVNTNAAYLARRLAERGLRCARQVVVSDEPDALAGALRQALAQCDVLITTGGLGPTFDDMTIELISRVTARPLTYSAAAAATIKRFYSRRHRPLQHAALRQAYLPQGGEALPNPIGTAPGLWLSYEGQTLIALPGVPSEMRAIMEQSVLPRLTRLGGATIIQTRTLRTAGLVELSIEAILKALRIPPAIEVGLYPSLRMVDIRLTATANSPSTATTALARLESRLRGRLGRNVYGTGDETLEEVLGALLVRQRTTLAIAESCTGGLVSDRITNISGSSRYVRGAVVAYHNEVKHRPLGVSKDVLTRWGAVSAQTAAAMAEGVRRLVGADIGLSVTGIAGPTGGTVKKPVGLVYLGLSDGRGTHTQRHQFFGDRLSIKMQAAQTALDWLRRYLLKGISARTEWVGPAEVRTL
ncbi:MAG: competence/damage-inducible protein A [Candidatus Omnitrophica bacterium]|nr:competence/damage-inducible protein A [Candidatus Omnitrophota bacterium]